jgi:hypothetical protein
MQTDVQDVTEIVTTADRPSALAAPAVKDQAAPPAAAFSKPNLALALSEAQGRCEPAPKDAFNGFHRYHYASAESIIGTAKAALASSGLALVPLDQTLNGFAKEGQDRFELVRKFVLLHSSGEWVPISCAWPVVPEKGRPLDKATAVAATLSLSYLLRDLLLMPRVEESDDAAAREDRPAQPAARPAPADDGEVVTDAEAAEIDELLKASGREWQKTRAWFRANKAPDMPAEAQTCDLTKRQYRLLKPLLQKPRKVAEPAPV